MDALVSAGGDDALREENWRLRQRLCGFEGSQRLLERQNRMLQRRIEHLEAQLSARCGQDRRQSDSAKREREWLAEHDSNVRALLHIIRHHEAAKEELQREVEQLQAKEAAAAAVVKVSRSAQTDESNGRWARLDNVPGWEAEIQANLHVQHLYERSEQTNTAPGWCDVSIISQRLAARSAAATLPASRPDFRSTVMKRLRQSQGHRPAIRPLPIPEEADEDDVDVKGDGGELRDSQTQAKDKDVATSSSASGFMHHCQGLEEQNRRLQERLESQQTLLDQLLSIKLDRVSSPMKPIDDAYDTIATSVDKSDTPEHSETMSSFRARPVFDAASGASDKQGQHAVTPSRASTLQVDTTAVQLPPAQQPHPMSQPAA